ncbi:MAG: epimerase [Pedobacter sp.]|nr:MAG: epimerase [Pedobacter sp.]
MKVIITGATGMIGEGVLLYCLKDPSITSILSVSRKSTGIQDPKLAEYLVPDFVNLQFPDATLSGYDACFFCAGVSSVGMSKADYYRNTYEATMQFAKAIDPKTDMTFIYVSGEGTNDKGWQSWARLKGQVENELAKLGFKQTYNYRFGLVKPFPQQKHAHPYYKYMKPLLPFFKAVFPGMYNTMEEVAASMLKITHHPYPKHIIYAKDIKKIIS